MLLFIRYPYISLICPNLLRHYPHHGANDLVESGLRNNNQTELIMPEDVYNTVQISLHERVRNPRYARVFMSLSSLLDGEFFNKYIKSGIPWSCYVS